MLLLDNSDNVLQATATDGDGAYRFIGLSAGDYQVELTPPLGLDFTTQDQGADDDRDSDFDGKYDLKEMYDANGALTSVRKDRDANGQPDVWEQYKDGVLIAILYDDDGDSKVDRREEVPGSRPKVEMPDVIGGEASGTVE